MPPNDGGSMKQALAGIKVLDFSTLLPGPLCTRLLAEAGAVKVARLAEAVEDPNFIARGLFARKLGFGDDQELPALPVPLVDGFRDDTTLRLAPGLGVHDHLVAATSPNQ